MGQGAELPGSERIVRGEPWRASRARAPRRAPRPGARRPAALPARGRAALDPVLRYQELAVQGFFGRSRVGLPVVAPFRARRHGDQDRLGATARLQAEQRAAVVDEVELDVARAPVGLEGTLALTERSAFAALDDRHVGGQEVLTDRARQRERMLEGRVGEIVEEDAADAARLAAVPEIKVFVAPALVARVVIGAERRQRIAASRVEMPRVIGEAVVG